MDLRDAAGRRRRDLDGGLVGLDLDERLVLRHLVALGHEPACDLALGQPLAEVGQLELVRHGGAAYLRTNASNPASGTLARGSPRRRFRWWPSLNAGDRS